MSTETDRSRLSVQAFASRVRGELVPLSTQFSYFTMQPMAEEDLRQYLHEPIAAISPAICSSLPKIGIALVPFVEKNGKEGDLVAFEAPVESRQLPMARATAEALEVLVMPIKDVDPADYHYTLYNAIAVLVSERWAPDAQEQFFRLIREELSNEVHGEVDERSWHLKQALVRRQSNVRKETKLFRDYARQAFEDTLTLYLHGTCCDIDVETGPRQMPSRYLRRRLELLMSLYPPPEGYAVLPEQTKAR
jgi:hypothetical protein